MDIRTKRAVGDEQIARLQMSLGVGHGCHVVRAHRRSSDVEDQARRRVKARQQMGHGEAAALRLCAGLAEVFLQLGCIRHGKARAVKVMNAMPVPMFIVGVGVLVGRGAAALKQLIEQFLWQAYPRLAISSCAEVIVSQMAHLATCDVAMQDLLGKQLNRGQRIECALAPSVAEVITSLFDPLFVEELLQIILDLPEGLGRITIRGLLFEGW